MPVCINSSAVSYSTQLPATTGIDSPAQSFSNESCS